ncbi:low molecular weight protein-tyrosine-phosphatase [Thalassotalea agarivorans]|uniref:Protein-tyrosine phosphatase n=1 Tax=Thalassotalea agarivorans TaxID=349064 RepID=A0A1I0DCD5_THASX|nr:low molecular weight protein-tyrosine-phosphatase [Thalassotalea agarivorans]SET29650.1 protein-tyrosine phosphatase [Thalassotalea agarivorans]
MENTKVNSLLFVCMGNICRSPTAEAVFRHKAQEQNVELTIDSAGTIASHRGEKPDRRSQKAGIARGYSFDGIRARQAVAQDFYDFDMILAMDKYNVEELKKIAPEGLAHKITLFCEFAKNYKDDEVPDPYYGGAKGFEFVLDLIEDASDGLLASLAS